MNQIALIPLWNMSQVQQIGRVNRDKYGSILVVLMFESGLSVERMVSERIGKNCTVLSFDDVNRSVSQLDVSEKVLNIISKIGFIEGSKYKRIYQLQANMFALNIHPSVFKLMLFDECIKKYRPSVVVLFGDYGESFGFPERTDVKTLLFEEFTIVQIVKLYLKEESISVELLSGHNVYKVKIIHSLRRLLLNTFKLGVTVGRYFSANTSRSIGIVAGSENSIAIIIRAQSEYWTVKPLIEALRLEGMTPVILQDDLIKNPSSKLTLDSEEIDYIPIHSAVNFFELMSVWLRGTFLFYSAARHLRRYLKIGSPKDLVESAFLERKILVELMASTLHAQPEVQLFAFELSCLAKKHGFKHIVTMDMVDQWCAAVGSVGEELGIPTLTIQNTVLDEIYYPRPVSTDVMAVSGEKIKAVLFKSGANVHQIHDLGLPLYDDLFRRYVKHEGQISDEFKIVVATQPFVQSLEYNHALISDIVEITSVLRLNVVIILKPHPREDSSYYTTLIADTPVPNNVRLIKSESNNILDLAPSCDLFLSRTSTAIQSFILLGRICVSYLKDYPPEICDRLDYLSHDVSIKCASKDELRRSVIDCVTDFEHAYSLFSLKRADYIKREIGPFDGCASERLSKLIAN